MQKNISKKIFILLVSQTIISSNILAAPLQKNIVDSHRSSSAVILKNIYQDPYFLKLTTHFYRNGIINDVGATLQTTKAVRFDAINQKICWNAIVYGIGTNEEKHIKNGVNSIQYTFDKDYKNGKFQSSSLPGTSRFLLAFAQSYYDLLLIPNTPNRQIYLSELDALLLQVKSLVHWIKNSPQWQKDFPRIKNSANQMVGMGLKNKLIGKLTRDQNLIDFGNMLMNSGMDMQTKEGVFLENGGFDSSYQAVNLQFLAYIYLYLSDVEGKEIIYNKLQKGWEYELTWIGSSGKISVKGNTRTGLKQEKWHGKYKDVNYPEVAMSLIYWSYISGDMKLRELARKIYEHGMQRRRNLD